MKLSPDIVDEVSSVVRESRAVPLPGGHGVWFSDTHKRFGRLSNFPGLEARCYVCLALLGDGDGEQRWNPKEWWPHATSWFNLYCPEIALRLDAPRWAYLLAALYQIVEQWCDRSDTRHHLIAFAADCYKRAEERLRQITRVSKPSGTFVSVSAVNFGEAILPPDGRWAEVLSECHSSRSDTVELLLFMHVLHSKLGLAQHSMDQRYSTRTPFYLQLQALLAQQYAIPSALHGTAKRIADAMSQTALLGSPGSSSVSCNELAARLPACFQLAKPTSQPPSRAMLERQTQADTICRDKLLIVYDLASVVADLAIDIFKSGGIEGPLFRAGAYDYLHSLVRYGPKMVSGGPADSNVLVASHPDDARTICSDKPITRSFADRMRSGLLVEPARERCRADLDIAITQSTIALHTNAINVESRP